MTIKNLRECGRVILYKYIQVEVIRWQVASFQMIAGSSLIFFKIHMKYIVFMCRTLKFWFQTDLGCENSARYYRQGRQLLLTLLTMVKRWSCSTSNLYALIGQNLTGELMRKIYAASWSLFTLTAEADRVFFLCDVFNCLFLLDLRNVACQSRKSDSDGIDSFSFSPCLIEKSEAILALLDSFQELHLEW